MHADYAGVFGVAAALFADVGTWTVQERLFCSGTFQVVEVRWHVGVSRRDARVRRESVREAKLSAHDAGFVDVKEIIADCTPATARPHLDAPCSSVSAIV